MEILTIGVRADLSAVEAVTLGSFAPGESVLVRGAGGSIGIMAVHAQLTGWTGPATVAGTPRPEKVSGPRNTCMPQALVIYK
jgi:NADPH:quinone reductase-like Zn-dependent oxidoreductase